MENLNESINRIKGLMKMIQEGDFNAMDHLPNKTPDQNKWELNSIIMYVMSDFARYRSFDDSDINLSDGYFYFGDSEGEYALDYKFDVNVTSHGSYDPGDYETPPYYEGPEWHIENLTLTISKVNDDGSFEELYSGPDISEFEKMKFAPREGKERDREVTGADIIYDEFDEKITELVGDNEPDYD
jgi:hypothetical protein